MCRLMFVVMCLGRVLVAGASIQPLVPDDNLEPSLASSSRVVVVLSPLTSGLNNQLMKVGYLLQTFCREPESRLVLPRFSTNLSHSQSRAWLAFGEVFDEEYFIQEFASKCTLLPSDYTPSSDQEKVQTIGSIGKFMDHGEWTVAVYRALRLSRSRLAPIFIDITSFLAQNWGGNAADYLAVHMRVESDWTRHCKQAEANVRKKFERNDLRVCFSPRDIAAMALSHPVAKQFTNIFIMCDVRNLPKSYRGDDEHPLHVWPDTYNILTPEDLAMEVSGFRELTYFERSVMSFFIGLDSSFFLGVTSSTMSNGLTMLRDAHHKDSYAYDCDVAGGYTAVRRRYDGGFFDHDNWTQFTACEPQ